MEKLSEIRIMGKQNVLTKVFVDESLICEAPMEAHLYDVLLLEGRPMPCYYCGENNFDILASTLSGDHFPLCNKCQKAGRGAAARRKSRKIKPKPMKKKKPVLPNPTAKRKRGSLV